MEKTLFEQNGGTYTRQGDYMLPDVKLPAQRMFDDLVDQIAKQEGITEQLKATNQMEWVKRVNCVRLRANEIVFDQVIHC